MLWILLHDLKVISKFWLSPCIIPLSFYYPDVILQVQRQTLACYVWMWNMISQQERGERDKILPAGRGGQVGHRVGERYETLHELPGQKHGASGHGGRHLDHL